jgi:hypothetical protein
MYCACASKGVSPDHMLLFTLSLKITKVVAKVAVLVKLI